MTLGLNHYISLFLWVGFHGIRLTQVHSHPLCPWLSGSAPGGPAGRWTSTVLWWSRPERSPGRSSCRGPSWPWTVPRGPGERETRSPKPPRESSPPTPCCRGRLSTYSSGRVQDFQHALLSIHLDLLCEGKERRNLIHVATLTWGVTVQEEKELSVPFCRSPLLWGHTSPQKYLAQIELSGGDKDFDLEQTDNLKP